MSKVQQLASQFEEALPSTQWYSLDRDVDACVLSEVYYNAATNKAFLDFVANKATVGTQIDIDVLRRHIDAAIDQTFNRQGALTRRFSGDKTNETNSTSKSTAVSDDEEISSIGRK